MSFGDESCAEARERLRNQAEKSGYFKTISILSEADLSEHFMSTFRGILRPGSRGFGYWIWKPEVVMQRLSQIEEGEVLLYLDVGCHILPSEESGMGRYMDLVNQAPSGVLCSELPFLERQYTKADVFHFFSAEGKPEIVDTGQRQGGVVFYRKSEQSVDFVRRWRDVCHQHLNLVDDSVSIHPNASDFIDHRHDQSIFSVLSKLHEVSTFPDAEIMQWAINEPDRLTGSFPIEARRDRYPKLSLLGRVVRRLRRLFLQPT